LATVAVAADIINPDPVGFKKFSVDTDPVEFKNTLAVTFSEKSSFEHLTLASTKVIPAPDPDAPISDPATTNSLIVNEEYDYVHDVGGSNRWLIIFRDPSLKSLNKKESWNDWTSNEPEYSDRTVLTITANRSNLDATLRDFEKRFSVFGAFFDGSSDEKEELKKVYLDVTIQDDVKKIEKLNSIFSNRTVRLNLQNMAEKYNFYVSDIYGANNDFAGTIGIDGKRAQNNRKEAYFQSNFNAVNLSLENNVLHFERIKGAKGPNWRDMDGGNGIKPLTDASNNVVYIHGGADIYGTADGLLDYSTPIKDLKDKVNLIASGRDYNNKAVITPVDVEFYLKPSIMGGDALKAQRNVVYLENVTTKGIDRKFGIVGGRAQDGTYIMSNTSMGADSLRNIVVLRNSNIGLVNAEHVKNGLDSNGENGQNQDDGTNTEINIDGTNVYGGLGYSVAEGNAVVVSHSKVYGNIQGGITFLENFMGDSTGTRYNGDYNTEDKILAHFNQYLEENYVFLDDAYLVGQSAVYASSGAMVPTEFLDDQGVAVPFVDSEVINFRRGRVFVNGANLVGSAFASQVVFGEKYNTDFSDLEVYVNPKGTPGLTLDTDCKEGGCSKPITLGSSLAESYIRTSHGFHSTLARQTPNQSNITNEWHNFWTAVTINLGNAKIDETSLHYIEVEDSYDGSGTAIKDADIFELVGTGETNRETGEPEYTVGVKNPVVYSLLKQDDAKGTKTYIGISSGYSQDNDGKVVPGQVRALNINWSKIIDYRIS